MGLSRKNGTVFHSTQISMDERDFENLLRGFPKGGGGTNSALNGNSPQFFCALHIDSQRETVFPKL
jgi:hypothetical protein